jgi:hypothetical protein
MLQVVQFVDVAKQVPQVDAHALQLLLFEDK